MQIARKLDASGFYFLKPYDLSTAVDPSAAAKFSWNSALFSPFVTASPSGIAGAFCRLSTSLRARDDIKGPTTEPKQAIIRHSQDKLLIHPRRPFPTSLFPVLF